MMPFNIAKVLPGDKEHRTQVDAVAARGALKTIPSAVRFQLERENNEPQPGRCTTLRKPTGGTGSGNVITLQKSILAALLRSSNLSSTVIGVVKVQPMSEAAAVLQPPAGASNSDQLGSYVMFLCEYCDRPYHDLPKLKEHEREHLAAGAFYSCCYCESNFISLEDVIDHRTSECFYRGMWLDQVRSFITSVVCTSCGVGFATADKLYEHRYNEYPHCAELVTLPSNELAIAVTTTTTPDSSVDQNAPAPIHTSPTKTDDFYFCYTCGKRYTYLSSYNRHVQSHEKSHGALECPWLHCKFLFCDRQHFKNHIAEDHKRPVLYQCPTCDMYFLSQKVFRLHVASHRKYPKNVCCYCNKQFERLAMLRTHQKEHGGKSPLISGRKMGETVAPTAPLLDASEFKLPPIEILDDSSVIDVAEDNLYVAEGVTETLDDFNGVAGQSAPKKECTEPTTEVDDNENVIVLKTTTPPLSPDTFQRFIESLYHE